MRISALLSEPRTAHATIRTQGPAYRLYCVISLIASSSYKLYLHLSSPNVLEELRKRHAARRIADELVEYDGVRYRNEERQFWRGIRARDLADLHRVYGGAVSSVGSSKRMMFETARLCFRRHRPDEKYHSR